MQEILRFPDAQNRNISDNLQSLHFEGFIWYC